MRPTKDMEREASTPGAVVRFHRGMDRGVGVGDGEAGEVFGAVARAPAAGEVTTPKVTKRAWWKLRCRVAGYW